MFSSKRALRPSAGPTGAWRKGSFAAAVPRLMSRSGWLRRVLLRRVHRIIDLFAGTRDAPKHQILLFHLAVRKRSLIEGQRLVQEGRLGGSRHGWLRSA